MSRMKAWSWFCCGMVLMTMPLSALAASEAELTALKEGFEGRREAMFKALAGKTLKIAAKQPPLGANRALYTRAYSDSITSFAMKAFWLDEQLDAANAAVVENCQYYISDRKARDDRDSFYWSADVLCRLVEFFGREGTIGKGRLSAQTEDIINEMMWLYCNDNSKLADADYVASKTWYVKESENHHLQFFSTLWEFSKLLSHVPAYKDRQYTAGGTPQQHYQAWTDYAKEFLRERVRKGLFVEMASKNYNVTGIKGIYNLFDFTDDPELRRLSGCVLDLYWATWGAGADRLCPGRGGGADLSRPRQPIRFVGLPLPGWPGFIWTGGRIGR